MSPVIKSLSEIHHFCVQREAVGLVSSLQGGLNVMASQHAAHRWRHGSRAGKTSETA